MPEVRFDDIVVVNVTQQNRTVVIDPKFLEVCEPRTMEVCGFASDVPIVMGASVKGSRIRLQFANPSSRKARVVLRLTGLRKGFLGDRFPDRTREQFERNEAFIKSAY